MGVGFFGEIFLVSCLLIVINKIVVPTSPLNLLDGRFLV